MAGAAAVVLSLIALPAVAFARTTAPAPARGERGGGRNLQRAAGALDGHPPVA